MAKKSKQVHTISSGSGTANSSNASIIGGTGVITTSAGATIGAGTTYPPGLTFNPNSSSGIYTHGSAWNINTTPPGPVASISSDGTWTIGYDNVKYKCSSCKKKKTTFAYTYQGHNKDPKFLRRICNSCHTKAMDKFYGVKGGKTEKLLFDVDED